MSMSVEQAMSYRSGHHSTSDDSSRYRTAEEMGVWRARDPATRFHNFIVSRGWWDDDRERQLRVDSRKQVNDLISSSTGSWAQPCPCHHSCKTRSWVAVVIHTSTYKQLTAIRLLSLSLFLLQEVLPHLAPS